ncbi:MAG: stage II sporulation protein P [Oscillospiraceae bacterium]|nr:stage II sporulation protein P [Oscillospiraceae bacterium]
MEHHNWSLRVGASVIACALLLRLTGSGFFQPLADFLSQPTITSLLLYLETGRHVRFSASSDQIEVFALESPIPATVPPESIPPKTVPTFAAIDAAAVEIRSSASVKPDTSRLIETPLQWDLTAEGPKVLILHTHATESYTKSTGEVYDENAAFRTLAEEYNMISIGQRVAERLEAEGISVLHDQTFHDYPSYNGSYSNARAAIREYLAEYPSIELVLDLHRDASGDNKNQMTTSATVNGVPSAQLMLVIGTNHEAWQTNLALALKLHVQLERMAPGICRYVNLRSARFNQDLSTGALLVEVGAAGNSHAEALVAAETLADAIVALATGANTEG